MIINLFFILILPFFGFIYLKYRLNVGDGFYAIPVFILTVFITLLFLYIFININTLREVKGLSLKDNKEFITQILVDLDWKICRNNFQFTQAAVDWSWLSFDYGKEIVILYDKENILINCVSFGRVDLKLCTHWFINRKKENEIIKEFEKRVDSKLNSVQ